MLCPFDNSGNTLLRNAAYAIGDELPTATRRLSRLCESTIDFGPAPIAIVKIDIQGSEADALLGATATLTAPADRRPRSRGSWPRTADVERILGGLGYTIHGLTVRKLVAVHDPSVFVSWDWMPCPVRGHGCQRLIAETRADPTAGPASRIQRGPLPRVKGILHAIERRRRCG